MCSTAMRMICVGLERFHQRNAQELELELESTLQLMEEEVKCLQRKLVTTNTGSGRIKASQSIESNSGVIQQRNQEFESIVQKHADDIKFLQDIFQIMKSEQNHDQNAAGTSVAGQEYGRPKLFWKKLSNTTGKETENVSSSSNGITSGSVFSNLVGVRRKEEQNLRREAEAELEQLHLKNVRLLQMFMAEVYDKSANWKTVLAAKNRRQNELERQKRKQSNEQELAFAAHRMKMVFSVGYWAWGFAVVGAVVALMQFLLQQFKKFT